PTSGRSFAGPVLNAVLIGKLATEIVGAAGTSLVVSGLAACQAYCEVCGRPSPTEAERGCARLPDPDLIRAGPRHARPGKRVRWTGNMVVVVGKGIRCGENADTPVGRIAPQGLDRECAGTRRQVLQAHPLALVRDLPVLEPR